MKFRKIMFFLTIALAGSALFYAILHEPAEKTEGRERNALLSKLSGKLKGLTQEIQTVQGQGTCDQDGQCRVVGLGTPVCGYYADYLIYSIQDADESQLLPLVAKFNETHKELLNLTLNASKCGIKPTTIRCVKDRCVP